MGERELNLTEEKNKAKSFCSNETYVFIQTKTDFYNGIILEVKTNEFIFLDDKTPASFPILFTSLKAPIFPSKKVRVKN